VARHKDANWDLSGPAVKRWEEVNAALLMDLRDELKELNRQMKSINNVLHCPNFTDMPRVLRQVRANTTAIKNGAAKNGK
jgi:Tfp pilus assembly protein PilO